jgi:putative transposase
MFLSRADSAARIIALESQLDASMRQNSPKRQYRFSHSFRFLWMILVSFWNSWETVCHAMKPRTVVGWWRQGFRRYWRSISQGKPGRKGLSIGLRKLIRRMSLENPLWGGAKIRDALVDLGYERLDVGTIRKYMKKRSKDPSGTWKAFLRNHMNVAWGMDFCVVRSVGFKALYVFVIIEHGRRKIRRIAVTETPSAAWVIQQLREATSFGDMPRFMHRDNDGIYGDEVPRFLKRSFIGDVRNSFRSPWQNPFIERFFGSLRRELLDHVIVWNASHLENLLTEYVDWYENYRLHQGLGGTAPNSSDTKDGLG